MSTDHVAKSGCGWLPTSPARYVISIKLAPYGAGQWLYRLENFGGTGCCRGRPRPCRNLTHEDNTLHAQSDKLSLLCVACGR